MVMTPSKKNIDILVTMLHAQAVTQDCAFVSTCIGLEIYRNVSLEFSFLAALTALSVISSYASSYAAIKDAPQYFSRLVQVLCLLTGSVLSYAMLICVYKIWVAIIHLIRVAATVMLAYCVISIFSRKQKPQEVTTPKWLLWAVTQFHCVVPHCFKRQSTKPETAAFHLVSATVNVGAIVVWVDAGFALVYPIVVASVTVAALGLQIILMSCRKITTQSSLPMSRNLPMANNASGPEEPQHTEAGTPPQTREQNDSGFLSSTQNSSTSISAVHEDDIDKLFAVESSAADDDQRSTPIFTIFSSSTSSGQRDALSPDIFVSSCRSNTSSSASEGVVIYDLLGCHTWPKYHTLSRRNLEALTRTDAGEEDQAPGHITLWLQGCSSAGTESQV
jgi:hypothetical protein